MKTHNLFLLVLTMFFFANCTTAQKTQSKEMETKVLIKTTLGDITLKLYNETEYHRDNFIKLVEEGYYEGLLFHRVINEFMVQGGDPDSKNAPAGKRLGGGGPGYTIPAEFIPKYFHKKGAIAAARMGDQTNPQKRSSGSQFYLVTGKVYTSAELDNLEKQTHTTFTAEQREAYTTIGGVPFLDGQYTVFGEITEGLDVIDKIQKVAKDRSDRPTEDVKIISMEIVK